MKLKSIFLLVLIQLLGLSLLSQNPLPVDSLSGEIVFVGKRHDKIGSKKKKMKGMVDWVSASITYPPMVFSIISEGKDTLVVKALTEVPSLKGIHPISFKLELVVIKKGFWFRASKFYFEDIKLSLQQWLDKYEGSENPRSQRNVELITTGIESHVFMSMNLLSNTFKK